jgi:hypothetical protein
LGIAAGLTLSAIASCNASTADDDSSTGGAGGVSGAGGSGATGGTGGSQGLGGSGGTDGSDASSPTPPAVGFKLTLSQPSPTVTDGGPLTCPAGVVNTNAYAIGAPAPGLTIADGTNGVSVTCFVGLGPDGTSMTVIGNMSGPENTSAQPISLNVSSMQIVSRDAAPAQISFSAPDVPRLSTLMNLPACTLGPFGTLKNGAMLADFDCPALGTEDDATIGCAAHGTLALEYCMTGE